jgi:hypothetical protein
VASDVVWTSDPASSAGQRSAAADGLVLGRPLAAGHHPADEAAAARGRVLDPAIASVVQLTGLGVGRSAAEGERAAAAARGERTGERSNAVVVVLVDCSAAVVVPALDGIGLAWNRRGLECRGRFHVRIAVVAIGAPTRERSFAVTIAVAVDRPVSALRAAAARVNTTSAECTARPAASCSVTGVRAGRPAPNVSRTTTVSHTTASSGTAAGTSRSGTAAGTSRCAATSTRATTSGCTGAGAAIGSARGAAQFPIAR